MANPRENQSLNANSRPSDLRRQRALSGWLADAGVVVATLAYASPQQLSLNWGLALSLLGLVLLFWEFGYADGLPTIAGPYRFVRDPRNLGLWLVAIGFAVGARSFAGVLLSLALLPWLSYLENESRKRILSADELRYRYSVPSLIPTLIPFPANSKLRFSWRRAVKIQRWPSRANLVSALLVWAYLFVSLSFNLTFWVGLALALGYAGIKLVTQKKNFLAIAFSKKARLSRNPL